jgi:hypothetical protein
VGQELTPDFPIFVGGMLAGICLFVAGLVYSVALPGSPALGIAVVFAALGALFLGLGLLAGGVLWVLSD